MEVEMELKAGRKPKQQKVEETTIYAASGAVVSIEKRRDQTRPDQIKWKIKKALCLRVFFFVCVAAAEDQKSRQMSWDNKSKQKKREGGVGRSTW